MNKSSHDDFPNKGTVLKLVQDRKNVISHIQTAVCALGPVFLMLIISSILSNMV